MPVVMAALEHPSQPSYVATSRVARARVARCATSELPVYYKVDPLLTCLALYQCDCYRQGYCCSHILGRLSDHLRTGGGSPIAFIGPTDLL
jgi:hypothetical protein